MIHLSELVPASLVLPLQSVVFESPCCNRRSLFPLSSSSSFRQCSVAGSATCA